MKKMVTRMAWLVAGFYLGIFTLAMCRASGGDE